MYSILTARNFDFDCQEDGCSADAKAAFTCDGDRATKKVQGSAFPVVRDCARSDMYCSTTSPTGCTDRGFVRCSGGMDRCDGDIKLGCDSCGFVSYHDCSWNKGHCSETPAGAACVPPTDAGGCSGLNSKCNGKRLDKCFAGQLVEIDCADIGLGPCTVLDRPDGALWSAVACGTPVGLADAGALDASGTDAAPVDASTLDAR
jgi:hypothetical protein